MAEQREFVYHQGKFYAPISEFTSPDTGDAKVLGVWEMQRVIYAAEVPEGAQSVQILPPGTDAPSDEPGKTWQERAIAAEMANAMLRARRDAAERRAEAAKRAERSTARDRDQAVRAAEGGRIEAERKRVQDLRVVAEKLAGVYSRTVEFEELNGPDNGGYGAWCDVHDELYGDHDHDYVDANRLLAFITDTLDLDHPAVKFPEPGPATIANACVLARTELASHGGTLDDVAKAILRMAAQPQRPEARSHR